MPSQKFTVTHPDGTVSTRTSKTRAYTHAIECYRDAEHARAALLAEAAKLRAHANALRDAAENGKVTLRDRGLRGASPEVSHELRLDVPGFDAVSEWCHKDGWIDVRRVPGEHDSRIARVDGIVRVRQHAREYADSTEGVAIIRERQAKTAEGEGYGVLRWSQSLVNVQRALTSREMQWFAGQGYTLRVVEVDR